MTTTHLSGNGVGTLQIVGGGEFRGGDSTTHKITDTFNMAGGLLGTSALDLNGSSESAANASPTTWGFDSTFSIEFWFNTTFNGSSQLLDMAESSGNGNRIQVLQTPSEMAFKLYNAGGSSYQIGTTAFTINPDDGKWHHLAFTTDGSTQKIYYDGRLAGEASHTITRDTDPTTKLTVGMHATLGGNFFGKIDELRFFSDVRTVGELRTDMFQGGTLADSGALVARYKFDEGYDTTIASTVGAPARNLTASGDGVWIAPGTFTYETCTLKFDKAGTCNLTGHQDGNATNMYSVHITNGTTVEANCRNNDLIMNSGSLMTNSGTLNSNRNWQYKSRNMPIVGASSDLVVGNNIWYYMSDGSGLPVSGAGTNYYQLRPATQVWMQGDFDCQNGLLQSGGDLHLNGHTCSTSKIWNYGGGNLHAEPGSSIVFDNADGFNVSYGENPTTMFFVASGENALLPNGNTRSRGNYFYTDAGPSTADGGAFGDSGSRKMSVSMWFKTRKDDNNADFGSLECVLGGNRGSSGEGSPMFTNYASTVIEARMHTSDPGGGGLGRAADVTVSSLSLDTWYHLLFTSEETGGDVVQNLYIHNADGTIFNTDTATGTGKTWNISNTGYEDWWIWGKDNRGTSNSYYMGHGMAMADVRLYDAILTSGNSDTLSTECPNISPSYADPANDLGAITQWKLGPIVAPYQTSSYTDSVGSVTLTPTGNAYGDSNYKQPKSGFVIINGTSTPFNPINNLYPAGVTLINTYISGSKDIIVGQRKENSAGFMAVPSEL